MARRLGDEPNELKIHDNISNSDIVLYFRTPTTAENVKYTNAIAQRKRNKIVSKLGETRQRFGAAILMGFREGDFEKKVGDSYVPIGSDETSKHYDTNWKALVMEKASDLVELLAVHVFESPAEVDDDEPEENEADEAVVEENAEKK